MHSKRASSPVGLPPSKSSSRAKEGSATPDKQHEESTGVDDSSSFNNPIDQLLKADNPSLPAPRPPTECPLFCCFYAEFDIVVGPKVAYQSPKGFMDQDTGVSTQDIEQLLEDTFKRVQAETKLKKERNVADHTQGDSESDVDEGATDNDSQEASLSIFDATSEYIITGNELAGKMINLSTHNMHILTRPTIIVDERYERNALLFCVGFVLRRAEDPRPFRPLLYKFASSLRSMEVENHFLSSSRHQLQPMLDRIVVSLNASQWECNLLLDSANPLNLRAFLPPKQAAPRVPDHAVPIIVREDLLNIYDWDLAIKWVALFIDGVNHARWIAQKSDVDMEMVRACLCVLKYHGVIALTDMFFYSNRYEFTERATSLLAGKEPELLQAALDFCRRRESNSAVGLVGAELGGASDAGLSSSAKQSDGSSFRPISEELASPSFSLMAARSSSAKASSFKGRSSFQMPTTYEAQKPKSEHNKLKLALAELYCSFHRHVSFADVRIAKTKDSVALQQSEQSHEKGIDWKETFDGFDHRRFASFGVVHGLLRRVHNYPLAITAESSMTENFTRRERYEETLSTSMDSISTQKASGNSSKSATDIARMMDGATCDDALACEFEKPLQELVQSVEATGRKVVSILAVATEHSSS